AEQFETATELSVQTTNGQQLGGELDEVRDAQTHIPSNTVEPALSPTIIRRLNRVVPTNLQIDARWDVIRKARLAAKKKQGKNAPSPSAMIAWAVVRAMEKHAPFRRIILD